MSTFPPLNKREDWRGEFVFDIPPRRGRAKVTIATDERGDVGRHIPCIAEISSWWGDSDRPNLLTQRSRFTYINPDKNSEVIFLCVIDDRCLAYDQGRFHVAHIASDDADLSELRLVAHPRDRRSLKADVMCPFAAKLCDAVPSAAFLRLSRNGEAERTGIPHNHIELIAQALKCAQSDVPQYGLAVAEVSLISRGEDPLRQLTNSSFLSETPSIRAAFSALLELHICGDWWPQASRKSTPIFPHVAARRGYRPLQW